MDKLKTSLLYSLAIFIVNGACFFVLTAAYNPNQSPPTLNAATNYSGANTATLLSTTRWSYVQYSYDATVNISLLAGQSITATLQYADDAGMSVNLVSLDAATTANSGLLGLTQLNTLKLTGIIPPGKYRKVVWSSSGSPTMPSVLQKVEELLFM